MTILIESMHKLDIGPYAVRIWREEPVGYVWSPEDAVELPSFESPYVRTEIAAALLELPRVNAVEVLDRRGHGVVFYRNWP
jgi:hypothetical protein